VPGFATVGLVSVKNLSKIEESVQVFQFLPKELFFFPKMQNDGAIRL